MEPLSARPSITWYDTLDSTNSEVRRRLGDLDNLSVIAASFQTAGRGRGSHSWKAAAGENLTFSILLRFGEGGLAPLAASEAVRITHLVTVALYNCLKDCGVVPRIKWPNDIWIGGKKICGILIENILDGEEVACSIVGIGLNLNQKDFNPLLPNPTSLSIETGRSYDVRAFLEGFMEEFGRDAVLMDTVPGREKLEKVFSENMFVLEKPLQDRLQASIDNFEGRK